ncbi:MAG: dihydrodipicolinate synthase family protein [Anaerolineales bacterium]|jgi:4-hydroxy-tetrahydrodipicolinate synthase|nr:dihydrodipicolinate synthase family protein [Anaerolineales bacterium]
MKTAPSHPLAGVYAAALTPLEADFSPDLEAVAPLLAFLASRGCHGSLLLGTTGEGPSFSPSERADIFRAALAIHAAHPDFRLLVGTGTPSLDETVHLTRLAFDLGLDGVVVLPPYYFRKVSDEGLFAYFGEIIRRAVPADRFLLGYHIPSQTGVGFSLDLLARLKDAFPRQFTGIKDSSHEAGFARALGARFGSDLLVLTGTDSLFQLALESGAQGCITALANLISPDLRKIWDGWQRGEDIAPLQAHVTDIRHVLEGYMPFPPILKALLSRLYGFPRWSVRPPLVEISKKEEMQAAEELAKEA